MMELVAIFSENRDECLEHYGVQGMKWGVWNSETARKRAGALSNKAARYKEKAASAKAKVYQADTTFTGKSKSADYAKNMAKAAKYQKKADRSMWNPLQDPYRRATNQRKAQKYLQRAQGMSGSVSKVTKLTAKANKYEYKSYKLEQKAKKLLAKADAMDAIERTAVKSKGEAKVNALVK